MIRFEINIWMILSLVLFSLFRSNFRDPISIYTASLLCYLLMLLLLVLMLLFLPLLLLLLLCLLFESLSCCCLVVMSVGVSKLCRIHWCETKSQRLKTHSRTKKLNSSVLSLTFIKYSFIFITFNNIGGSTEFHKNASILFL